MIYKNEIEDIFKRSIDLKTKSINDHDLIESIDEAANSLIKTISNGKKIFIAGNGGSAADSQHMAAELVSKFYHDRQALPAIALTTDTSILTSISNDYEYTKIFARQIEALGSVGDIFIAITTSGNSKNLIEACITCQEKDIKVVGLTGNKGGALRKYCDILIDIDGKDTPRIQETHLLIEHILCDLVEQAYI
jgi:D-sedoheptulose 7-phosphate isomerase